MLAVLVGYLALIVLVLIGGLFLAAALRGASGSQLVVGGEVVVFVAAVISGAITARMAPSRPLAHAGVLGLTILSVTAIVAAISPHNPNALFPGWYPYAAAALGGAGAFVGGALSSTSKDEPEA
jgi:hypothetical protein